MKRRMKPVYTLFVCLITLALAACGYTEKGSAGTGSTATADTNGGNGSLPSAETISPSATDVPGVKSGVLVVYFSQPETASPENMTQEEANSTVIINGEVLGNTQYMAYVIQQATGGDIFRIEPETPYAIRHEELVDIAKKEQQENARPKIKETIENFDRYETVFVGYPNWWGDMPMILYTFFDTYDFTGKTIVTFNTHGGSGFSDTNQTIAALEQNAAVISGLTISRNDIQQGEGEIVEWLKGLGYSE